MSNKQTAREVRFRKIRLRRWLGATSVIAVLCTVAKVMTPAAQTLGAPPVSGIQRGVLDIMMVAMPQPIPGIAFQPPNGGATINLGSLTGTGTEAQDLSTLNAAFHLQGVAA